MVTLTRANSTPGSLDQPLYLPFTLSGTATPGVDYTPPTSNIVVFWPGEAITRLVLPVLPDTEVEGPETLVVTIDPPVGVSPPPIDTTITITDPGTLPPVPPVPPAPTLPEVWVSGSLDGEERTDGLRPVVFQLSRTNPHDPAEAPALTVGFSLGGTASSVSDYFAPSVYSATFAPGQMTTTVALAVISDSAPEAWESVSLTALAGTGYVVREDEGMGWAEVIEQQRGLIAGHVWLDAVQNGLNNHIQDANDAPKANARVDLYRNDGRSVAETLTDDAGNYSFENLPFGDYRVVVSQWGIERFVQPNAGGSQSEAIDSDVDEGGTSDLIPVYAPGSPSDPTADIDAGLHMNTPTPSGAGEKSVHFLKPGGWPAAELKVAKWSGGKYDWSRAFKEKNPGPGMEVRRVEKDGTDFIDADPDRFNVYVKHTAIAANSSTIDVPISTVNSATAVYSDDPTVIRLSRVTTDTTSPWWGWYWSDSQILVSNEADDTYWREPDLSTSFQTLESGGTGKDWEGPTTAKNHKGGQSFFVGDRTHRVGLGDTVVATYTHNNTTTQDTAEVPIRKSVKLKIRMMQQPGLNNGQPFLTSTDVERDVQAMRTIYAQAGIDVTVDGPTAVNVPADVDLTDGMDTNNSAEEAALLDGIGRTPAVNGKHDIEIYYVNNFTNPHIFANALSYSDCDNKNHVNVVFIRQDRHWKVLAHEVGHVLDDTIGINPHYPYNWCGPHGTDQANLRTDTGQANNHALVTD